jgi:hypothetical protein
MRKPNHETMLGDMRNSLDRIKALTAWQQLKQSEQYPGRPPAFVMYDPTHTDLNNEYSRLVATCSQLQTFFNASKVPTITIGRTRREYLRLKQELNALNVPARIKGLV